MLSVCPKFSTCYNGGAYALKKWITVQVGQVQKAGKYFFQLTVDGYLWEEVENRDVRVCDNMELILFIAGDAGSFKGAIRDFQISEVH